MDLKTTVEKFLRKRGWYQWYNENAWCHPKIVADPKQQDPTNYCMDLESAFLHEVENLPPFAPMGLPKLSQKLHEVDMELLNYYFGEP